MTDNPTSVCPEWLKNLDPRFDTLAFHLQHPEVAPDEYIRSQQMLLGSQVLAKRRIYLDLKYWIYCRDVARGKPKDPNHEAIYECLLHAVKSGLAVCPANHLILEETLKQEDPESRLQTALLVQELSAGVTLQPFPVLFQIELLHFLEAASIRSGEVCPCEQMVWTYIGNIYGHGSPIIEGCDESDARAIQKAWFDLMAGMTFTVFAQSSSLPPVETLRTPQEFYDKQNDDCLRHRSDFRSFQEVFLIELAGNIDVYKDELSDAQLYLFRKYLGQDEASVTSDEAAKGLRLLSNLIYHAFRLGKIDRQLPGLRIMAGIHAAIRYKRQKHRRGDRHDHLHARSALPYCDLFLTEKTLGHLLCDKPLEFDKLYGCRVAWTPEDALSAIKGILEKGDEPTTGSSLRFARDGQNATDP